MQRLVVGSTPVEAGLAQLQKSKRQELSEMLPGRLYQTGMLDSWKPVERGGFTMVIDLTAPLDPIPKGDVNKYVYWPLKSAPALPDLKMLKHLGAWATREVRDGGKVLVHCDRGMDRSSLITAVILRRLGVAKGEALVDYIRAHRQGALPDPTYASFVADLKQL